MHADMRPFAPFSQGGGLTGWIAIENLQWICVAAAAAALLPYAARRIMRS